MLNFLNPFWKHFWSWNTQNVCSEGYMKYLMEPEGCRDVGWISLPFICNTHKPPLFVMLTSYKCTSVFNMILFILLVYCMHGDEYICFWGYLYLNLVFWGRNDPVCFLSTWKCSGLHEHLFEHINFFAVVFSSAVLRGDWRNLYNSPLIKVLNVMICSS
jgi:hypothetical protein